MKRICGTTTKKMLAWLLVVCTVFSGLNVPALTVYAEETTEEVVEEVEQSNTGTEEIKEEVTEEVTTENVSSDEVKTEESSTEEKTEEITSEEITSQEETTESVSEETSEEETEETTEKSTEEEDKDEEITETNLHFNVGFGGFVGITLSDGSKVTLEKTEDEKVILTKDNVESYVTGSLINGYYVFPKEITSEVVKINVQSKADYQVETYSKKIDDGESSIKNIKFATYNVKEVIEGKDLYFNIKFSKVEDKEKEDDTELETAYVGSWDKAVGGKNALYNKLFELADSAAKKVKDGDKKPSATIEGMMYSLVKSNDKTSDTVTLSTVCKLTSGALGKGNENATVLVKGRSQLKDLEFSALGCCNHGLAVWNDIGSIANIKFVVTAVKPSKGANTIDEVQVQVGIRRQPTETYGDCDPTIDELWGEVNKGVKIQGTRFKGSKARNVEKFSFAMEKSSYNSAWALIDGTENPETFYPGSLYTFKGAEYTYKITNNAKDNWSLDGITGNLTGTFTLDKNGSNTSDVRISNVTAKSGGGAFGTNFDFKCVVTESKAPYGYKKSSTSYEGYTGIGDTGTVLAYDEPSYGDTTITVNKVDKNNNLIKVAGQHYTVKYYAKSIEYNALNLADFSDSGSTTSDISSVMSGGAGKFNMAGVALSQLPAGHGLPFNVTKQGLMGIYTLEEENKVAGYNKLDGVLAYLVVRPTASSSPETGYTMESVLYPVHPNVTVDNITKTVTIKEPPEPTSIEVRKYNGDSGNTAPLVNTNFAGIEFTVSAAENIKIDNVDAITAGTPVGTITLNASGIGSLNTMSDGRQLPAGLYNVVETKGNEWYSVNNTVYQVRTNSAVQRNEAAGVIDNCQNVLINANGIQAKGGLGGDLPYRGDFSFQKWWVRKGTEGRADRKKQLSNIAFKVTNSNNSEAHIVVTDSEGKFTSTKGTGTINAFDSLANKGNSPSNYITNAEINALNTEGNQLWFGLLANNTMTNPYNYTDGKRAGALPIGTYKVEELYCENNANVKDSEGELYSTTIKVTADGIYEIPKEWWDKREVSEDDPDGIINEPDTPTITTKALGENTGIQLTEVSSLTSIIDTVSLNKLAPKHVYGIKSYFVDLETGETMLTSSGQPIIAEKIIDLGLEDDAMTFISSAVKMDVNVQFVFDMHGLEGKTGIVQMDLYDITEAQEFAKEDEDYSVWDDENIVASERSMEIESQMVQIPKIETEAYSFETEDHQGHPVIIDGYASTDGSISSGDAESKDGVVSEGEGKDSSVNKDNSSTNESIKSSSENIEDSTVNDKITGEVTYVNKDTHKIKLKIHDKVSMYNFIEGKEFIIKGYVKNIQTNEIVGTSGENSDCVKVIESHEKDEYIMDFEFEDVLDMQEGTQYVVYEEVYYKNSDGEEILVAEHKDDKDENQKIYVTGMDSDYKYDANGGHNAIVTSPGEKTLISDYVYLNNTKEGYEYSVTNTMRYKDTGEVVVIDGVPVVETQNYVGKALDEEGKNITTMFFEYNIDTSSLRGKEIVFTEEISYKGNIINKHDRLDDEREYAKFPDIKTTAKDIKTLTNIGSLDSTTIVDTVDISNVVTGEAISVKGTLMDKATGDVLGKDLGIEPITSQIDNIIPETSNFTRDLNFEIPNSLILEGKDVVVFEEVLGADGRVITFHKDINDLGQTVTFMSEKTTAIWDETQSKLVNAEDKVFTLRDTVTYTGAIIGKEYTQTGTLMKDDGEGNPVPLTNANGQIYISAVTFTAIATTGSVDITFEVNTKDLAGETIVVFEDLYMDGIKVATHADLEDKDQTVYVPKIGTTARAIGSEDEKTMLIGKKVGLTDTVEIENLIIDEKYELRGYVYNKKNKKKVVENTLKFKANEDGEVSIDFELDTEDLQDCDLVVFEEVYDKNGNLVAEHKDWDDEGQTVHVPIKPTIPRTDDWVWLIFIISLVIGFGLGYLASRYSGKMQLVVKNEDDSEIPNTNWEEFEGLFLGESKKTNDGGDIQHKLE